MIMDNKLYDTLKWIAQYFLPGLATLYFAIAPIWGLPYTEAVIGTIMAVDVFLGTILGISNMEYEKSRSAQGDIPLTIASGEAAGYTTSTGVFALTTQTYDRIKWTALTVLPALGALYFALSRVWGFPYGQEIVGTIGAITAFLGIFLGVSSAQMKKSLLKN